MTAQILAAELTNLIQESKRKNTELRNAADKSFTDLKALPSTSEAQLAADLSRRPYFISPFIVGCNSRSAKLASPSLNCLFRLAVCRGLPRDRLKDVLEALKECSTLSLDIQLKVLQAVLPLLQNYAGDIQGVLLNLIVEICSTFSSGRNPALTNTAAATLQQVVIAIFDKVAAEDEKALEIPTTAEVPSDDGPIAVRPAAQDAYRVFHDLCLVAEGKKPQYVVLGALSQAAALELIGAVLDNHGQIISSHDEQANVLRVILLPFAIRSLSDKTSFQIVLRVMRIVDLVIRQHIDVAPAECEIILGLLNHMLDPDAAAPWKRTMCLEVWRGLYADSRLILGIFSRFDEIEGKKNIVQDNFSTFVRLATEKPALIGLGNQSTAPIGLDARDSSGEQAAAGAGAMADVIGGSIGPNSGPPTGGVGLSTQWSTPRSACLEQLDKSDPPQLPETYIHSLILACINNLSESLAKFILPLTVHTESRTKKRGPKAKYTPDSDIPGSPPSEPADSQTSSVRPTRSQSYFRKAVPVNPLSLESHSAYHGVAAAAHLIAECWPAVLATSSTFLYATLDADYYRTLVRSIQKFTQVAGLLRLSTPRDAFLTTLGKAAVPPHILATNLATPQTPAAESPSIFRNKTGLLSVESLTGQLSTGADKTTHVTADSTFSTLNTRNLLCLRALLNLAIALGPTLETSWAIVFETLQQADIVLAMSNSKLSSRDSRLNTSRGEIGTSFNSEVNAVQAAATRLFESTTEYPNEAFLDVLGSLCGLLQIQGTVAPKIETRRRTSDAQPVLHQRRVGSYSGISLNTESDKQDYLFALGKIGDLATLNLARLTSNEPKESGWDNLRDQLVSVITSSEISGPARLLAADILSRVVRDSISTIANSEETLRDAVQRRALTALYIENFYHIPLGQAEPSVKSVDLDVHKVIVDALKAILERSGESLATGWDLVFKIILTAFWDDKSTGETSSLPDKLTLESSPTRVFSVKLARAAFSSVQLICSDFLSAIPDTDMSKLVDILHRFCSQEEDLNMSLTTNTFFWNVSDHLYNRIGSGSLEAVVSKSTDSALFSCIMAAAKEGSIPAIWLQMLLRLALNTVDDRVEVRNGVVQTVLRIFGNCGESFTPEAWEICMQSVLVGIMQLDLEAQRDAREPSEPGDQESPEEQLQLIKEWNQTTKLVLEGMSNLVASYIGTIRESQAFTILWKQLIGFFKDFLSFEDHEINTAVFNAVKAILEKLSNENTLQADCMGHIALLWIKNFPARSTNSTAVSNDKAFEAYLESFKEMYRLISDDMDAVAVTNVTENIVRCIREADSPAYTTDVDSMTRVQQLSMDCLRLIRTNIDTAVSSLIMTLAKISRLPFAKSQDGSPSRGLSYVALSKAAMQHMRELISANIHKDEIFESSALISALSSVVQPIALKYRWRQQGKSPGISQEATSTSLIILKAAVQRIKEAPSTLKSPQPFWNEVVKIANGIISADCDIAPLDAAIGRDEAFDAQAFETLRELSTPLLGSEDLSDISRRMYCSSLFQNSLAHAFLPAEIMLSANEPLAHLYTIRLGRTFDPAPAPRTRIAYMCFSELISLVSLHDGSAERVKLAQAAAPYLILRAAIPIKAYIADQPLRGRMPLPQSQRDELLFVLSKLKDLNSEPKAIPDAKGVKSLHKKHLHRMYPLLVKAIKVAKRDPVILGALQACVDVVGQGFMVIQA